MASESKTLTTVFSESAIALALIVIAIFIAGFLQEQLSPGFHGAYVFYFAFAMTPFLYFGRSRGVFQFDRWDLLSLVPFLVLFAVVNSVVFHFRHIHPILMFAIPASIVLFH